MNHTTADKRMKVFAGVDFAPNDIGNQVRVIVAATTRAKAIALLRASGIYVSAVRMASHWGMGNEQERETALSAPGQVFVSTAYNKYDYYAVGAAPAPAKANIPPQELAQAIIDSWRGLPGELMMLKGVLCLDHTIQAAYEKAGAPYLEARKAADLGIDRIMIAARMDELRGVGGQ